jgi:hypothetical protein
VKSFKPIGYAWPGAVFGAVLGALLLPAAALSAQPVVLMFRCVNVTSHASWDLKVDTAGHTADGFPAEISPARISWRDGTHGGSYELDRATGELTFSNSSSMGGYMLFHRCRQVK